MKSKEHPLVNRLKKYEKMSKQERLNSLDIAIKFNAIMTGQFDANK